MTEKLTKHESGCSVRFSLSDIRIKDNEISLEHPQDGEFNIHLGFLQYEIKYNVKVPFPKSMFPTEDCSAYEYVKSSMPDSKVESVFFSHDADYFYLSFNLSAQPDISLAESLQFKVKERSGIITINVTANVLGTGKGTPLLKNGIHVIEVPHHLKENTEFPRNSRNEYSNE